MQWKVQQTVAAADLLSISWSNNPRGGRNLCNVCAVAVMHEKAKTKNLSIYYKQLKRATTLEPGASSLV